MEELMSDVLAFGIRFSIIGMSIVFGVLTIISIVVTLIRFTDKKWQSREKAESKSALTKPPTVDDTTLVIITADVAPMISGRHRIKSVRRVLPGESKGSPWSMQGRAMLHGSHIVPTHSQRKH